MYSFLGRKRATEALVKLRLKARKVLKRVAKEIGNGLWVTGDLSKTQSVRRMFEKTGELDSVITVYVTPLFFRACTQAVTPP